MCSYRIPEELVINLDLEELVIDLDFKELTLTELLEVEIALVTFMLSILLLRCCHITVHEVSKLSCFITVRGNWRPNFVSIICNRK